MPEKSGTGALFVFLTVFLMCDGRGRVCAVIEPLVSGENGARAENKNNLEFEIRNSKL
jgi:hypothetical protein